MIVINTPVEVEAFEDIEVWGGAREVKEEIIEKGLQDEAMNLIEEIGESWDVTELNDYIWFDLGEQLLGEE